MSTVSPSTPRSYSADASGVQEFDPTALQTVTARGPGSIFIAGDASDYIQLLHEAATDQISACAASVPRSRVLR